MHDGRVVAAGPIEQVRAGRRLEDVFIDAVGGLTDASSTLSWLNRSDAGEAADGA